MPYRDFPPVVPGALIFSGLVLKQPHGMLASIRGKQRRLMELTIGHDLNLTPVLAYYEHPKPSDSVPKGVMYIEPRLFFKHLGRCNCEVFADRNELSIRSELSSTHEGTRFIVPALPPDVHVVTDLLLGFESSGDAEKWFAAINHALATDIDSQTIASNSPTLSLTQVT
jgi:hypothetical protein